jgi:phage-related minor tail protein
MADDIFDQDTAGAADPGDMIESGASLNSLFDNMQSRMSGLTAIANAFARAMTAAFYQSARSGRQFESVLRSLALRLSSMLLNQAFRSLFSGGTGGASSFGSLFSGLGGGEAPVDTNLLGGPDISMIARLGAIKPFAGGGVIGTPTYFPLATGGVGLAGEAGPEAILPLARTSDGRLGVAARGHGGAGTIVIQIMTPDAESFRRSEAYVTGQIARAVARGQRSL